MTYRKNGRVYRLVNVWMNGCMKCPFFNDAESCWATDGDADCTKHGDHEYWRETLFSKIRNWRGK